MITTAAQIDACDAPAGHESEPASLHPSALALPPGLACGSSPVVATRVRQCPRCRVWVPAGCYRLHTRRGGESHRLSICDECRWQAERDRRQNIARSRERKAMHRTWADLARSKEQRRAITSIIGRLWPVLGGSAGIAKGWADALKTASAAQKVRSYEGYVRMVAWLSENPEAITEAGRLSDEELAVELANARAAAFVELLLSDPATAGAIAEKCGYQISAATKVES